MVVNVWRRNLYLLSPSSVVCGLPSSSLFQSQYILFYTWGDYFNFITSLVGSGEESAYHLVASHSLVLQFSNGMTFHTTNATFLFGLQLDELSLHAIWDNPMWQKRRYDWISLVTCWGISTCTASVLEHNRYKIAIHVYCLNWIWYRSIYSRIDQPFNLVFFTNLHKHC